ncbi:MAG: EamA family transporter RarD [Pararhizobium sp.]
MAADPASEREATRGFLFALGAYLIWGLMPLYMKAVAHISPIEIVAHRVLWSIPIAIVVLALIKRTSDLAVALRSPRTLALAAVTGSLIFVNWSVYVYAIAVDRTIEAALGYYINPLLNVVLGAVFLGERFTRRQLIALSLAAVGVAILAVEHGGLPWISLALALSFGCYGFLRKTLPIGPTQGFTLEVLILLPVAIGLIVYFAVTGTGHFGFATGHFDRDTVLLLIAGPFTAAPLILYASGAKRLRYSTIGLMQYITPTMIFLLAVFVFREPFDGVGLVAFGFIWLALIVYSSSLWRLRRDGAATGITAGR